MISRFIEALRASADHITDEDVADILWLAMQISATDSDPARRLPNMGEDARAAEPGREQAAPVTSPTPEPDQQSTAANLYPAPEGDSAGGAGGVWFRSPGATALPGALALGRALRPFKRRVGSRVRSQLDEAATARSIAEEGIWRPTLRPVPGRWLDVALVVDGSRSMDIWQQIARELQQLLERHGAFRDVRVWTLIDGDGDLSGGALSLRSGLGPTAALRTRRDPMELVDAGQRRLILVLSDCVATAWRDGRILRMLARWGQTCPVTLVQTLPQRMWARTILRYGQRVRMRAPTPGAPNARLRCEGLDAPDGDSARLLLPVVTLDARAIAPWARAMTAGHAAWTTGYALTFPQHVTMEAAASRTAAPAASMTPKERLRRFRTIASPEARELATLLAAAPVSLPIIALIQRTLLPESKQYHVAEVLLSGLFEERPNERATRNPARIQYEFRPGVRELLLESLPKSQTLRVLTSVSAYVRAHAGMGLDFPALLADSTRGAGIALDDVSRPFAAISALALRGFGGSFAALADRLQAAANSASNEFPIPLNPAAAANPAANPAGVEQPVQNSVTLEGVVQREAAVRGELSHTASPETSETAETAETSETPRRRIRSVFISATIGDLHAHRQRAIETVLNLGLAPVAIERMVDRPSSSPMSSLAEVTSADAYLGVIAWRYGYIPPDEDRSITHMEYEIARAQQMPCFIFLADPETDQERGRDALFPVSTRDPRGRYRLDRFRAQLMSEQVVEYFTTPEDLASRVYRTLAPYTRDLAEEGTRLAFTEPQRLEVSRQARPPRSLPAREPHLVGQEREVESLLRLLRGGSHPMASMGGIGTSALAEEAGAGRRVAIVGMGGVGKSALAAEVVYLLAAERGAFRRGIASLRCDGRIGVDGLAWVYDQLASTWNLTIELEGAETPDERLALIETTVRPLLSLPRPTQRPESLILLDGVEPDFPLDRFVEALVGPNVSLLVTTRSLAAVNARNIHIHRVGPPSDEDAVQLFVASYIEAGGVWDTLTMERDARALVTALGYLPLAIKQAAAAAASSRRRLADMVAAVTARTAQPEKESDAPARSTPRIFMSYSRRDYEFARRLAADLETSGASAWIDINTLAAGSMFVDQIAQAISNSDWLVLALTPNALVSDWVQREVEMALDLSASGRMKGVIPVLAEPVSPGQTPLRWARLQWVDATRDYASALTAIQRVIGLEPAQGAARSDEFLPMALDEFMRMVSRREVITARALTRVVLSPSASPIALRATRSRFTGCTLNQTHFAVGSDFISTSLIGCHMDAVVARGIQFLACRFERTSLEGVDFSESNFAWTLFSDVTFGANARFPHCNFTYARLQEVRGSEASFTQANMNAVALLDARLTYSAFSGANLINAKLLRSDFRQSDFRLAVLQGADLEGASFVNCDLEGANFEGARNVERADFSGSNWREARFDPDIAAMLAERYSTTPAKKTPTGARNATAAPIFEQANDDVEQDVQIRRLAVRLRRARTIGRLYRIFTAGVEELTHSGYNQVFLFDLGGGDPGHLLLHTELIDDERFPNARRYDVASMDGVIGSAVKRKLPICVDDVRNDADYIMVEPATRSELALPILHPVTERVLGVVNVEHQQYAAFSTSTIVALRRLVAVLAAQLVRLTEPRGATPQTPT